MTYYIITSAYDEQLKMVRMSSVLLEYLPYAIGRENM